VHPEIESYGEAKGNFKIGREKSADSGEGVSREWKDLYRGRTRSVVSRPLSGCDRGDDGADLDAGKTRALG